jgi:tetratricopeptide (TPR) repeat protein/DNA-binding CsgD family transcriptional regulator
MLVLTPLHSDGSGHVDDAAGQRKSAVDRRLALASTPEGRLSVILEAAPRSARTDPEYAIALADEGVALALASRSLDAAATLLQARAVARTLLGDPVRAAEDLRQVLDVLSEPRHADLIVSARLALADALRAMQDHRGVMTALTAAVDLAGNHGLASLRADALTARGEFRTTHGDFARAIEDHFAALSLRESLGDGDGTGRTLLAIGDVYRMTGDLDAAHEYFRRSAETFREAGNRYEEVRALTAIAGVHLRLEDLKQALEHAMKAMAIYELLGDDAGVGRVMAMIGTIREKQGSFELALELQLRAYTLLEHAGDDELGITILLNVGRLHAAMRADADALFVLDQALRMARALGSASLQLEIHRVLADLYEKLGKLHQGIEHLRRHLALKDEIAGRERQKAIAELQVRYDIEKAEREREIYRLRAQQLEAEMRLKQNELTAMALNLVQKKELLDELTAELERLRVGGRSDAGESMGELLGKIRTTAGGDDDWKRFEKQLDHLHQDFIRTLSERFPSLTPAQLKICSLIRLDLPTKDIANLLFTSTRTIDAHKYNIRKKLELAPRTSLTTFLAGLTSPKDARDAEPS